MRVIYIDVLWILNAWVDFLLLSATARMRKIAAGRWRLLLGAACGAFGSCLLFLPPLSVGIALGLRVAGTVILCLIAFPVNGVRRFTGTVLTFGLLSAVFSGVVGMLWYYAAPDGFMVINGAIYYDMPASVLIVLTAVSYGGVCLFEWLARRRVPRGGEYTLTVRHGGQEMVCTCLYDSGCTLKEPFSGKAAVVVEAGAIRRLLPAAWNESMLSAKGRLIPFKTLSGEGLLPAFVPQYMTITSKEGKKRNVTGSYLAVSERLENEEYMALIGTDIGDLF